MGENSINIEYPAHFAECENCPAVNSLILNLLKKMDLKQVGLPVINESIQLACKMEVPNAATFTASGKMFAMDELTQVNDTVESSVYVTCPGYQRVIKQEQNN